MVELRFEVTVVYVEIDRRTEYIPDSDLGAISGDESRR